MTGPVAPVVPAVPGTVLALKEWAAAVHRARFEVPEDFDEPLPAEILAEFHGGIDP